MKMYDCKPSICSTWRALRTRCLPVLAVALTLACVAGPSLAAGAEDEIEISGAIARDVLIGELQSRGLVPPADSDLTIRDYLYNNAGQARFNASVGVWLGAKGQMVPSPEWQNQHKDYCKNRGRSSLEAAQLLAFDMHRIRESLAGARGPWARERTH